jgi:anti-sigma regulatory factor (Ser/Thr protein kinase)
VDGRWNLAGRFEEVATARRGVRELLRAAGYDDDTIYLGELATGELVANAMEHGGGSDVQVVLRTAPEAAMLTVTNEGSTFVTPPIDLRTHSFADRGRGLAILSAFGCTLVVDGPHSERCAVTLTLPARHAGAHGSVASRA